MNGVILGRFLLCRLGIMLFTVTIMVKVSVGDTYVTLCNTACPGTGPKDFVNPHNIKKFIGCTVIQGEIRILPTTFFGYGSVLLRCSSNWIEVHTDGNACFFSQLLLFDS